MGATYLRCNSKATANPPTKSDDKNGQEMFNWSEVHSEKKYYLINRDVRKLFGKKQTFLHIKSYFHDHVHTCHQSHYIEVAHGAIFIPLSTG